MTVELNKYLDSAIYRKIIKFFQENPACVDTSRGIATWINENLDHTEAALKKLAEAKIIIPHGDRVTPAYGYTTDAHMINKVKTALKKSKSKRNKHH